MRLPHIAWIFLPLLMAACTVNSPKRQVEDDPCVQLDSLLQLLGNAQVALEEGADWPVCSAHLQPLLEGLRENMHSDTGECNFLNMRKFPDVDRLIFVDLLRDRIEADTLPQGIYYLLHLHGIFNDDPDISEFFAEELAHVAHNNPHCFQGYLDENPDQEVMLLYSTKWNRLDLDTLIHQYAFLDSGGAVVVHLEEQKEKADNGI
jgi:hypothetical protein